MDFFSIDDTDTAIRALVVPAVPQITIGCKDGDVYICVCRANLESETCETNTVEFPIACVGQLTRALSLLAKAVKGGSDA